MYKISIYNKSKKLISVYERIHTVKYSNGFEDTIVAGEEMLSHYFPTDCNYQLLSDSGNYSIDSSVIGTFEVTKVCYWLQYPSWNM